MTVKGKRFVTGFYLIFLLIISGKTYADEKLNVLFISSYNPSFISFEDQVRGIKAGLENNVNLEIEYMDSNVLYTPKNEENFYNLLKYTLSNYKGIDAVVVGDDEALEYCLKYREDIFKDIPMVFFAVSRDDLIQRALEYDLTSGVKEIESVDIIIDFIRKFHKEVENIVFINNYDNEIHTEKIYNRAKEKYENFNFQKIITSEISVDNFKSKLRNLDEDDAIIRFYPAEFADYDWLSNEEVSNILKENSNKIPKYNVLRYGIGSGSSIGGRVIDHYEQGRHAGEIVRGILDGKNPRDLYVGDDSANEYVFDYNQLKKFGIKKKELPKELTIINSPISFIKEHESLVITIVCLILCLICIIIALISYVFHKRKYEKSILKAMHAAEDANRLKAHFISNISHELKTPITVIMSVMQFSKLNSKKENSDDCTISEYNSELINTNCYRLLRLLNNVIDVDKVDSVSMKLNLKNINIIEVIEETVLSVVPYADTKQINIIFDTNYEEVICAIDCDKIERVILNLLSNAIKFSRQKGNILVEIDSNDKVIKIKVKDDGIGIEEKDLHKIFDRFIQIDNSLTRQNEGSGIGLSIVKSFVNLHGGRVNVKSQVDEGTEFTVTIPKTQIEENNGMYIYNKDNIKRNARIELSDIYF